MVDVSPVLFCLVNSFLLGFLLQVLLQMRKVGCLSRIILYSLRVIFMNLSTSALDCRACSLDRLRLLLNDFLKFLLKNLLNTIHPILKLVVILEIDDDRLVYLDFDTVKIDGLDI